MLPRSEGNIIHELDGGLLPARIIAESMAARSGSLKDIDFFVGIIDQSWVNDSVSSGLLRI